MKVAIVGGAGHLGTVIAKAILQSNACSSEELYIYQRSSDKAERISIALGCKGFSAPSPELLHADLVILSVKPQDFLYASQSYQNFINRESLVISVMAGVSLQNIKNCWRGARCYIRAMPNLPLKVGKGVVAYFPDEAVSTTDTEALTKVFSKNARLLKVSSESLIDAATAVSGSGPAYFFRLGLAMQEAAKALGFTPEEAKVIVEQTAWGSAAYWEHSELPTDELIRQVRSKRGTTDAALTYFDNAGFDKMIEQALSTANMRAVELSKEVSAGLNTNIKSQ